MKSQHTVVFDRTEPSVCFRCGKPLKRGEKVISRNKSDTQRHYHVDCWRALFH